MTDRAFYGMGNAHWWRILSSSHHTTLWSLGTSIANTSDALITSGALDFGRLEDGLLQRLSRAFSGIETILHNGYMANIVSSRQVATQYQNLLRSIHSLNAEISRMSRNRVTLSPHNWWEMITLLRRVLITCENLAVSSENWNPEQMGRGIREAEDYVSQRSAYQQSTPLQAHHPQVTLPTPPSSSQPSKIPVVWNATTEKLETNVPTAASPWLTDNPQIPADSNIAPWPESTDYPSPIKSEPVNTQTGPNQKMIAKLEQHLTACFRDLERHGLRSYKSHLWIRGFHNLWSYWNLDEYFARELIQFSALLDLENRTNTGDCLSSLEVPVLEYLATLLRSHQATPSGGFIKEYQYRDIQSILLDLQDLSYYGVRLSQIDEKSVSQILDRLEQRALEEWKQSIDSQVATLRHLWLLVDTSADEEIWKITESTSRSINIRTINRLSHFIVNCRFIAYFLWLKDLAEDFRKAWVLLFEKSEEKFK